MVNVDDLLTVINDWGCNLTTEGNHENAPKSIQDCYDRATERDPNVYSLQWYDAYDRCIEALCLTGEIQCD